MKTTLAIVGALVLLVIAGSLALCVEDDSDEASAPAPLEAVR